MQRINCVATVAEIKKKRSKQKTIIKFGRSLIITKSFSIFLVEQIDCLKQGGSLNKEKIDTDIESMLFNIVNNISTKNRQKITTRISKKQCVIITKNL